MVNLGGLQIETKRERFEESSFVGSSNDDNDSDAYA